MPPRASGRQASEVEIVVVKFATRNALTGSINPISTKLIDRSDDWVCTPSSQKNHLPPKLKRYPKVSVAGKRGVPSVGRRSTEAPETDNSQKTTKRDSQPKKKGLPPFPEYRTACSFWPKIKQHLRFARNGDSDQRRIRSKLTHYSTAGLLALRFQNGRVAFIYRGEMTIAAICRNPRRSPRLKRCARFRLKMNKNNVSRNEAILKNAKSIRT